MASIQNIDEETENEYMCSRWVRDVPVDVAVATYVKQWTEMTSKARVSFNAELNIPYDKKEECKCDVYWTEETAENAPVFIIIHGGYWQECSKEEYGAPIFAATRAASIAVMVGYQLAPKATLDEIVGQVKSAVVFLAKRFSESPLYLCGHSAGAHLTAMMMIQDSWQDPDLPNRVKGVCLISGLFDLLPILKTSVNDALKMNEATSLSHKDQSFVSQTLKSHGLEGRILEIPKCDHFSIISRLTIEEFQLSKELYRMLTKNF